MRFSGIGIARTVRVSVLADLPGHLPRSSSPIKAITAVPTTSDLEDPRATTTAHKPQAPFSSGLSSRRVANWQRLLIVGVSVTEAHIAPTD
jgi:hypothetical protein